MKNKTSLEELMDFMVQRQYFIGNDLYAKYHELLQKDNEQQLIITDVVKSFYCFSEAVSELICKEQCLGCNTMKKNGKQ